MHKYSWLCENMPAGWRRETLDKLLKPGTIKLFLHPQSKYGNITKEFLKEKAHSAFQEERTYTGPRPSREGEVA